MKNKLETRKDLLVEALERCYDEMYRKSQPKISWNKFLKNVTNKVYGENVKYPQDFHYISIDEFNQIKDKYTDMYNIKNYWNEVFNSIKSYFINGGSRLVKKNNELFLEPIKPIRNQIKEILSVYSDTFDVEELEDKLVNIIFTNLDNSIMNNNGHYEVEMFNHSLADFCPSVDKEKVINNWKSNNKNIRIVEKVLNPFTGEYVFPNTLSGYKEGLVFNHFTEEWVTPEELERYENENRSE